MISILSARFKKQIAFFLLGIFYAQLIIAGHMNHGYEGRGAYYKSTFSTVVATYPFGKPSGSKVPLPFLKLSGAVSPVDPHKKSAKKIHLAPRVQPAKSALASRLLQPGAMATSAETKQVLSGGPTQPEMQAFQSVNSNNMVDMFSGDFSYNIPLLDVGGYPVNLSYRSGVGMDDDASWVGLGWNINPGSITRNMRGLPDDFDGSADTVRKVAHVKPNFTWGVNVGADFELVGLPILELGGSLGIFHNTYNGWGSQTGFNASLNSASNSYGPMSGGLNLTDNSQNGLTISPSISARLNIADKSVNGGNYLGANMGFSYNSRTGIKSLELGISDHQDRNGKRNLTPEGSWNTAISFAGPTYNPTISIPTTNQNYSLTVKLGGEFTVAHPSLYASGYVSTDYVATSDTALALPAYGYMNFQDIGSNYAALTDFNREKEIPYREKPAIPHIAVPSYTYDVFSISGEGTGGMFRAYRGDIGFIADPLLGNKSISAAASLDLGGGDIVHAGIDLNANYSTTVSGPWLQENALKNSIKFQGSNGLYEGSYFRNPGEKAINTTDFYNAIGGDDVVAPVLYQAGGNSGPSIVATNTLTRYSGQEVTPATAVRDTRDKRSEVISYLNAKEASVVGLDKYIYHYAINQFALRNCQNNAPETNSGPGKGLEGYYFKNVDLTGSPFYQRLDHNIAFNYDKGSPFYSSDKSNPQIYIDQTFPTDHFSIRWLGRLQAPVSGGYSFATYSDDGVRFWINDSLVIDHWAKHARAEDTCRVNLVGGEMYNIKLEYYENTNVATIALDWKSPLTTWTPFDNTLLADTIPGKYLYPPVTIDTAEVNTVVTQENRVNTFRQPNHISEINVLNPDGRRYVYGIPVYNLQQKEYSFNVNYNNGQQSTGLTGYTDGLDNTTGNTQGKDGYFSKEQIPAYAHSFLLTGILSPDYVDVTGDGISDDDIGDAVRFNYSKAAGIANPFGWRAPYITDSANYNEGFRSYTRDDKGNYIYGTKELWYLNSIESKTMIATFTLQHRSDLLGVDERGHKLDSSKGMCLKEIDLYSKADFLAHNGPVGATPIKTVHFEYSYELCRGINMPVNDSGKLTLKSIWFTYNGNDKGALNPYVFNYHPNNPNYKVNTADKWGTYKDASQNPGASPTNPITNAEYPYALQDSTKAAYNAAAWTLDSIQLPSGGRIKVNYESDDYAYVQNRQATQMCKLAGFGVDNTGNIVDFHLYNSQQDKLYAYVTVPFAPANNADLYARYLSGLSKLYFRLYLQMPSDIWGSGYDYVPCYADPDTSAGQWYGMVSGHPNTIWVKLTGVNKTGDGGGSLSPLAETAINYLRLNLPDKAYPGSEVNDNLDIRTGITIIKAMASNITEALSGLPAAARSNGWVNLVDTSRSYIRLDCPILKKFGGGIRVKSILIYDNWKNMTSAASGGAGRRETVYGQTYDYTTTQTVNGVPTIISSGVASWEPSVGSEENPFHLPIEYVDRASMLAPAAALYTEEPLGESFYPGASVGYSDVKVRSINTANVRSANGYSESKFYTSYDFPTSWDYSMLDNSTKKRYKPFLANFLRINAQNYLTFSQGFKVELNDMNGKERSQAVYAQTDSINPISYTENFYRVDNPSTQFKHLSNTVTTIDPFGNIDTAAIIGKDAELMTDMREQNSNSIGGNINLNTEMFTVSIVPVIIPSLLDLFQHENDRFRSVAMMKVIQRYGILDSVIHIDKGSKISSKNVLYDSETGDALLVRTQNEFNDPVYQFTYPSHWMYDGVGLAYQNIDAQLQHLTVQGGKITAGLPLPDTTYLSSGDELLISSKLTIAPGEIASFPDNYKLWVVDTNILHPLSPQCLYLMDQYGTPFSGNDVSFKVTRSGHRNMGSAVGAITSLANPLITDGLGHYNLKFDSTTEVVNASANELQQIWKVADKRRSDIQTACAYSSADSAAAAAEGCACLKPLFNYLIANRLLLTQKAQHTTVRSLVDAALAAGYTMDTSSCPILTSNMSLPYYALTGDSISSLFQARVGNDIIDLRSVSGMTIPLYQMVSGSCDSLGRVKYTNPGIVVPKLDTITLNLYPGFSVNLMSSLGSCPFYLDTLLNEDSTSDHLMVENNLNVNGFNRNSVALLRFDSLKNIPVAGTILSATLILQADTSGHIAGLYPHANSTNPVDSTGFGLLRYPGWFPYFTLDTLLYDAYYSPWNAETHNGNPFQNDTIDVSAYLQGYLNNQFIPSTTFVLTQGSGGLSSPDSLATFPISGGVPQYLLSGYNNYYSTYYNQHYSDSTKWPVIQVVYIQPQGFLDTTGALLEFNSTISCNTIVSRSCFSSITDTLVNPYQYGILGNFRPLENYVYYNHRKESDPTQATNIRTSGTISSFAPFWNLQSGNWSPSYDSSRWVWNSQTTLYNRKGFELENRDPLGRYNSGLYGYGLTLPTAVTQNSRNQEMAFEGFEDYGFIANTCDTVCPETRPFDFSAYQYEISDSTAHTGLYSMRVPMGETVSISAPVAPAPDLSSLTLTDTAGTGGAFAGIKASSNSVLPPFEPYAGKRMEVGAWVKEANLCSCQQYTQDTIHLSFTVSGVTHDFALRPTGNMIEGWQRYDTMIDIPTGSTNLILTLKASNTSTTYFDDIRIHPFNADMKSYVYNPINLRLMAELDENNYATFYEYDDDGTLIRVKKETERGILTIKETRSALLKSN